MNFNEFIVKYSRQLLQQSMQEAEEDLLDIFGGRFGQCGGKDRSVAAVHGGEVAALDSGESMVAEKKG